MNSFTSGKYTLTIESVPLPTRTDSHEAKIKLDLIEKAISHMSEGESIFVPATFFSYAHSKKLIKTLAASKFNNYHFKFTNVKGSSKTTTGLRFFLISKPKISQGEETGKFYNCI